MESIIKILNLPSCFRVLNFYLLSLLKYISWNSFSSDHSLFLMPVPWAWYRCYVINRLVACVTITGHIGDATFQTHKP